jgi:sortase A
MLGESRGLAASPAAQPAPSDSQSSSPAQLVIPSIGLNAEVEWVEVDQQGNLGVPSDPARTAWYQAGPAPGEQGDAVIDGHLDWTTGPAVFWRLDQLQAGDEIDVFSENGDQLRFTVTEKGHYPYDSHPSGLFSTQGPRRLSLITCAGSWDRSQRTYLERLIVDAGYVGRGPSPQERTRGEQP